MRRWITIFALLGFIGVAVGCGSNVATGDANDDAPQNEDTADTGVDDTGTDDTGADDTGSDDTGTDDAGDVDPEGPCDNAECGDSCCPDGVDDCGDFVCDEAGDCVDATEDVLGDAPFICEPGQDYDPCQELQCGDSCSLCPPDDPDCVEQPVVRHCDDEGHCVATDVECPVDPDPCEGLECGEACCPDGVDETDCDDYICDDDGECVELTADSVDPDPICPPDDNFDPCEGLQCGEPCAQCPPDEPDCAVLPVEQYCDDDGQCVTTIPECEIDDDPCQGVECGDSCGEGRICDAAGQCVDETNDPGCKDDDDDFDPCEGLQCGDPCNNICPPDDPDCIGLPVEMYCDANGECQSTQPVTCI